MVKPDLLGITSSSSSWWGASGYANGRPASMYSSHPHFSQEGAYLGLDAFGRTLSGNPSTKLTNCHGLTKLHGNLNVSWSDFKT